MVLILLFTYCNLFFFFFAVLLKGGKKEEPFRDCADVYQAGFNKSGIYTIYINNMPEPKKVFCNMELNGGGWTIIQHREDGSVDFQRGWKEYKMVRWKNLVVFDVLS